MAEAAKNLDKTTKQDKDAVTADKPAKTTKAGPRSAKAVKEAQAENTRKAKASEKAADKKQVQNPPDPLRRRGKAYRQVLELVDRTRQYELDEAVKLAKKTSPVKFDAAVELHINLGADPKQSDQVVRTSAVLPAGTGKSQRVAVIAPSDQQKAAKAAGADLVGDDDLIDKIEKNQLDFDILIATPDMMSKLGKVAKVLGPKGLMPNPKSGTVTADAAQAVKEAKAGKIELRMDKQAIVHQGVGRVSFKEDELVANVKEVISALQQSRPAGIKGTFITSVTLSTSMGPGIKLDPQQLVADSARK